MTSKEKMESLNINSTLYKTRLSQKFLNRKGFTPPDPRKIQSFIPGTVVELFVKPGQEVKEGDLLLILDAMKMKNRLKSPMDGVVKEIVVNSGERVRKGTLLIVLE
jgi:biotin carboxyl carrier protein